MSSTYRIICLSHDPAWVLDMELQSGQNGRAVATSLLQHGLTPRLDGHAKCDLVIGRYSYSLVEIGYRITSGVEWLDAYWLGLGRDQVMRFETPIGARMFTVCVLSVILLVTLAVLGW